MHSLPSSAHSMEEHRHILPSNFSSQQLDIPRPRHPLTDSTGNAHYHNVASGSIYGGDQKGHPSRVEYQPPTFTLPTLPSQPASHSSALAVRRKQIQNQRARRSHNPIVESEHYQAYRSRQTKDGADDQKWPADLEDLFLEGKDHLSSCATTTDILL
jgi:hypothetical protein